MIEDSAPFCPKCGAPQIRVTVEEGNQAVTPPFDHGTPGGIQPPATPVYPAGWNPAHALNPRKINWRMALPGAALAGIIAGVLMILPYFNVLFFVWIFLAGSAAALAYRNKSGNPISGGMGAKIGALAGMFASILPAIGFAVMTLAKPDELRTQLRQALENSPRNSDPATAKAMQDIMQSATSPEGLVVLVILSVMLMICFFVIVCAVGGAAGSTLKRERQ